MRCHCRGTGEGRCAGCSAEDLAKLIGAPCTSGERTVGRGPGPVGFRRHGRAEGQSLCVERVWSLLVACQSFCHNHTRASHAVDRSTSSRHPGHGCGRSLRLKGRTFTFTVSQSPRLANAVTINNWTSLMRCQTKMFNIF